MGKNNKVVSLKIPNKANEIIEFYKKDKTSSYVFPYLKDEFAKDAKVLNSKTRSFNSLINKQLNKIAVDLKIDKKMTMHTLLAGGSASS